jgi:F0F1-type ATP synthase membrane subunit b/b'
MATTESRSGFRLPWAGEHRPDSPTDEAATTDDESVRDMTATAADADTAVDEVSRGSASAPADDAVSSEDVRPESPKPAATKAAPPAPPAPIASATASGRKPSKFLADLTKAMQAAAGAEREETLELFRLEAKSVVETIHARSATEADELRKRADDDVASIREWSKQEIARIREETDRRISARKTDLTDEIDDHAARIEREIERVHALVGEYEGQMEAFFEALLAETDPTRFAALAASMPEPPAFDSSAAAPPNAAAAASTPEPATGPEPATESATAVPATPDAAHTSDDQEAAFAAIEAAARAADDAADAAEATTEADAMAGGSDGSTDSGGTTTDDDSDPASDPRLAALGIGAGFEAAEAEALVDLASADDEIPEIGDEALSARLAGLVPAETAAPPDAPTASGTQTTVTVVGLVSVASIASFKRHLARVAGVSSVGVSSGPDGEFVFAVHHESALHLADVVTGLPGFGARVTDSGDGFVKATAHDPDAAS